MLRHPDAVVVADGRRHARRQLLARSVEAVVLLDPRLGLHHLGQRPEADALAVGERSALPPPDDVDLLVDAPEELGHEPRLADPGDADDRDELRLERLTGAIEGAVERVELALAPDEREERLLLEVHAEPRAGVDDLPHADRLRLALRDDRFGVDVVDRRRSVAR